MTRSGPLALLPQPVVEDLEGGGLVDEWLLLAGGLSGTLQLLGCCCRAQALVGEFERNSWKGRTQLCGEGAYFFRGTPLASVHAQREADEQPAHASFSDQHGDTLHRVGAVHGDRLDGMGRDTEGIGGGEPDAGLTMVDGKNGVFHGGSLSEARRAVTSPSALCYLSTMSDAKVEAIRQDFLRRTGVDLQTYGESNALEGLGVLSELPLLALRCLKWPLLVALVAQVVATVLLDGSVVRVAWLTGGSVLVLVAVFFLTGVLFVFAVQSRLRAAVGSILGLVEQVALDLGALSRRRGTGALDLPSVGETTAAVTHVVVVPQVGELLSSTVPLVGGLLKIPVIRLLRWWARREERRSDQLEAGFAQEFEEQGLDEASRLEATVRATCGALRHWSERFLLFARTVVLLLIAPGLLVTLGVLGAFYALVR